MTMAPMVHLPLCRFPLIGHCGAMYFDNTIEGVAHNTIGTHWVAVDTSSTRCGIMDMVPMVSSLTMHDDGTHGPPPTFLRICMIRAVFSSLVSHDLVSNVVVYPASILRSCSSSSWTTLPPRISPSHFAVGILAFLVHRFSLLSVAFTS